MNLIARNKETRKNRPITPKEKLYTTYENNGVFQICFKSGEGKLWNIV